MNKSFLFLLAFASSLSASNNDRLASQQQPSEYHHRLIRQCRHQDCNGCHECNYYDFYRHKNDHSTLKTVGVSFATSLITSMVATLTMFKLSNQ